MLTCIACFLVAKAIYYLSNNKELFRQVFFVALTLPWGFVQANRIWDPALVPIYFSIHFYFLSLVLCERKDSKKNLYTCIALASLVLLAVIYPPCRIPAVAMWVFDILWLKKENRITMKLASIVILICGILSMSLLINMFDESFNSRAASLLVFRSGRSPIISFQEWLDNFAGLCGPQFLFVSGDSNERHAIPYFGVLGTMSFFPLLIMLKSKLTSVNKYMLFVIGATFISVALTNEGMPHALRSCLAWLPFSVLIGNGWYLIARKNGKTFSIFLQCVCVCFFVIYFAAYSIFYTGWFL